MKKIVVCYHADCPDGFGAAWVAWKKFGRRADYIPAVYDDPPPRGLVNRELYLLDFTYPDKQSEKLFKKNTVIAIDHHVSRKETVKRAYRYRYAVRRSGAVLAWLFFFPREPVPWLLRYIEDRDLWRYTIRDSNAVLKRIDLVPFSFPAWSRLARLLEKSSARKQFASEGKSMLQYESYLVGKIAAKAGRGVFERRRVWIVNTSVLRDQVADTLLSFSDLPIVLIWQHRNKQVYVSLRSRGSVDVSRLAARYGGGGHKHAAGFTIKAGRMFPWKYEKRGTNNG
jgi:hypothetical protein